MTSLNLLRSSSYSSFWPSQALRRILSMSFFKPEKKSVYSCELSRYYSLSLVSDLLSSSSKFGCKRRMLYLAMVLLGASKSFFKSGKYIIFLLLKLISSYPEIRSSIYWLRSVIPYSSVSHFELNLGISVWM